MDLAVTATGVARRAGTVAAAWAARGGFRDLFAAQIVSATAALLVNVMSARGMGPDGRGALAFYLQIGYVASAVLLAGTERALPASQWGLRSLRTAEGMMLRLLTPSLALTVLLLGGLGVAAGTGAITGDVVLVAAALALALWGNTIMVSFRTAAIAAQSTGRFLKITIAGQVSLVFGAALLLAFSVAAPAVWLSLYGGVFLLPTAVALLSARPKTKGHDQERAATRRLGLRLAPTVVANMVMLRSDRLLLPVLSDPTQLGLYIVVAAVTELIAWPVQNYVDGRVPLWRRALVAGSFPAGRLLGGAALFGVGGVAVVGSILTVLLVPLFGGDYSAARSLIWPLAIASGLYAFSRFGVAMTVAANRSSLAASIDVSGMLVAAFAYVVLIPSHGALGAAVGSLLGYGIAALASTLAVVRLYRRDVPEQVLAD